jgi:hypothetical protein
MPRGPGSPRVQTSPKQQIEEPSASAQVRLANLISGAPYKSPDGYVHPPRTGRNLLGAAFVICGPSARAAVRSPRVPRVEHPRPVVLPGEAEVPGGRPFAVWGTLLFPCVHEHRRQLSLGGRDLDGIHLVNRQNRL